MTSFRQSGARRTVSAVTHPGLRASDDDRRRAFYYSFQPNMMLSIQPDYVNYYTLWPVSATQTVVESEWMFHPDSFGWSDFNPQDAIDFWDVTNRQDWRITGESQIGIMTIAGCY